MSGNTGEGDYRGFLRDLKHQSLAIIGRLAQSNPILQEELQKRK